MRGLDPRIHLLCERTVAETQNLARTMDGPKGDTCDRAVLNQTKWETV
jgi:hypothetical protein